MASADDRDELAACRRGEPRRGGQRHGRILVAVHHQHWCADTRAQTEELGWVRDADSLDRRDERCRLELEAPRDEVLDLSRGMRFATGGFGEELDEVAVAVFEPVVTVEFGPALRRLQPLAERVLGLFGGLRPEERTATQTHEPAHAFGPFGGGLQPPDRASRKADQDRVGGLGGVEHCNGVGRELGVVVRGGRVRPVRATTAPAVEGHDPEVAGEIRNLRLPAARMDDRPCREERDGRVARPEQLPMELHAVALGVTLRVAVAGSHPATSSASPDEIRDATERGPDRDLVAVETEQQVLLGAVEHASDERGDLRRGERTESAETVSSLR